MTDRNGFQTAQCLDRLHGLIIQIRNTIPENIALRGTYKVCRLANGELWFSADGDEVGGGGFVCVHGVEDVFVFSVGAECGEGEPCLTCWGDVLSGIETDGTFIFEI